MTIQVLETQQTHQIRRSKQWNQNHMNQTHVKKKKKIKPVWKNQIKPIKLSKCNQLNRATDQTNLPSKRKSNPSPISTSPSTTDVPYQTQCWSTHQTHRRSTHPPLPREPDFRRHWTELSSSTLHQRQTDVGLPRGFLWWAWTSLLKDTGVRVGVEWKKKKTHTHTHTHITLKYFQLSYSTQTQK